MYSWQYEAVVLVFDSVRQKYSNTRKIYLICCFFVVVYKQMKISLSNMFLSKKKNSFLLLLNSDISKIFVFYISKLLIKL